MFKYYSISECPIEYFKDFIDKYSLDKLKRVCENSECNHIDIYDKDGNFINSGYIKYVEYYYSEKLKSNCIRFYNVTYAFIKPKCFEIRIRDENLYLDIII